MSSTPLSGPALEAKVKELLEAGKSGSEVAREVGFLRKNKKTGEVVADLSRLNRTLNEARGIVLTSGRGNRSQTGFKKVSPKYVLTIGKTDLAKIGACPGQQFKTEVVNGRLTLTPVALAATPEPALNAPAVAAPSLQQPAPTPALV